MVFQFAGQFNFQDLFQYMKDFGVYDYILPFLLVVAIVFAILEKTQIFGANRTNINAIIGIVVGLLLVAQQDIVATINLFLPRVSLIMVVILMGLVVVTLLGGKTFEGLKGVWLAVGMFIAIIAVILALSPDLGWSLDWLSPYDRSMLFTIAILVGIVAVLYFLLAGRGSGSGEGGFVKFAKKALEDAERSFGGR